MRRKIISLLLALLMVVEIVCPSVQIVYADSSASQADLELEKEKKEDKESDLNISNQDVKQENETKEKSDFKNEKISIEDEKFNNIKNLGNSKELSQNREASTESESKNLSEIYLDSKNGNDDNDGTKEKPFKTFAKAIEKAKDGDTLNVVSLSETNITVDKQVTLKFINDVTMQGSGTGIDLSEGSHLTVADGKTLTMTDYATAINVKKDAEINDGNYVLDKNETAFSLADGAKINGTSKDKLKISAKEQTGSGFSYSSDSWFIGCSVYVEGKLGSSEQYSGLYMKDASLTTKDVWYYFNPDKQTDGTFKGGLHLDNSEFYVYKAKGVSGYKNSFGLFGPSEIKNNSTVTADGSRVTVSEKLVVKDSKFIIKTC